MRRSVADELRRQKEGELANRSDTGRKGKRLLRLQRSSLKFKKL